MKRAYRRWVCGLLALILALLAACAAVVYYIDPCLYYRMPDRWDCIFFSERYQAAGLVRNVQADTVVMGTSMAANYRASHVEETFGGTAVRITIPDGYFSEFDKAMDLLFRSQTPERILFALDMNTVIRDESGITDAMPGYLYNDNRLDDVKYLLNKDTLYYSFYVLMANRWHQGQTPDEGFTWDDGVWWNHMTALEEYQRPEQAAERLPADAYVGETAANLAVIEGWLDEHPETEFDIFFSPYSMLFWDKTERQGRTDAVFSAMEQVCTALLTHPNVRLYAPLMDAEIVDNLDNYCDYVHHSGAVCDTVLRKIAAGEDRLTEENQEKVLADWRDFTDGYHYEKFWDTAFWEAWNASHPQPVKK